MKLEGVLRIIGFVVLTLWWLPLGLVFGAISNPILIYACLLIIVLLRFTPAWEMLARSSYLRRSLTILKWLLVFVPVAVAAVAYSSGGVGPFNPALWWNLLFPVGWAVLACCLGALMLIAPLLGARNDAQVFAAISTCAIGYLMTAYSTVLPKVQFEPQGLHIDSIDAIASAMLFAPTAGILLGLTMAAVVSRERHEANPS